MSWTEELPELPGIYKLTNLVNGKIYIGESSNTLGRIGSYLKERNKRAIIRAIKKYGWNSFKKEAIETFPQGTSKEILRIRETFWIKFLRSHILKWGYNEIEDTYDIRGKQIQKWRKIRLASNVPDSSKKRIKGVSKPSKFSTTSGSFKSKPVYQLDLKTGEVIKEWPSIVAASIGMCGGVGGTKGIYGVIHMIYGHKSYYGFGWRFVHEGGLDPSKKIEMPKETREKLSQFWKGKNEGDKNPFFGKKHSDESKKKMSKIHSVPCPKRRVSVDQINAISGDIINTYQSVEEAHQLTMVQKSSISNCINGKRKTAGGFKWRKSVKLSDNNSLL